MFWSIRYGRGVANVLATLRRAMASRLRGTTMRCTDPASQYGAPPRSKALGIAVSLLCVTVCTQETNRRETRLAQGTMEVADVHCSSCGVCEIAERPHVVDARDASCLYGHALIDVPLPGDIGLAVRYGADAVWGAAEPDWAFWAGPQSHQTRWGPIAIGRQSCQR